MLSDRPYSPACLTVSRIQELRVILDFEVRDTCADTNLWSVLSLSLIFLKGGLALTHIFCCDNGSAQELDEFGITVNAYAPGLINTPMCMYFLTFCTRLCHSSGTYLNSTRYSQRRRQRRCGEGGMQNPPNFFTVLSILPRVLFTEHASCMRYAR